MRAFFSFLYGLAAYAASLAALLYLMGFTANWRVPTSVDVGIAAPWGQAVVIDLLLLALFGLQHSVMARRSFKRWWTQWVGPTVERSTFILATSLVLALLYWQWRPIAAPTVWRVEQPVAAGGLMVLFWLGWALALISTFLINHFELLCRHVRHPLYLGLLLAFWSTPVMSAGHLLFSAGASLYILIGIAFEERDLVAQFGERYRRYREQVGMLVPRRRAKSHDELRSAPPR